MTLARINDADVGRRSTGYGSMPQPQQPKSRGHRPSWEIRNKTLPEVMANVPYVISNLCALEIAMLTRCTMIFWDLLT